MPSLIGRALRNRRAGQDTLVWQRPGLKALDTLVLSSPAFGHGEAIPERFRGRIFEPNISPELIWTAPPAGTAELVLIVQDPDAPGRRPAMHVVSVGIAPDSGGIPENGLRHPSPVAGLRHGDGLLRRRGWAGPMPIPSHGPHLYAFQLFALDRRLDLPERFSLDDALRAMDGRVIARGRLDGTYEIR